MSPCLRRLMPQDFEPTSRTNTLTHCGCRQKLLSRCLFRSALDINLTLQIRAFLDRNPLRGNIAVYHGTLTQFDAVAGLHVAVKFPLNNHAFGLNRCFDLTVGTDGQTIVLERNGALDLPICAKAADNRALMDVILKESGYPFPRYWKSSYWDGTPLLSTIPN